MAPERVVFSGRAEEDAAPSAQEQPEGWHLTSMALDVGEDRMRKAAERLKSAMTAGFWQRYLDLHSVAPRCTPLHPIAPRCTPTTPHNLFRPQTSPYTSSRPLTLPHTPLHPFTVPSCTPHYLPPPHRQRGLDCVALECAIGEARAAALEGGYRVELEAADAVLAKARAAETAKCEKDLRDKMKARPVASASSLGHTILTMARLTVAAARPHLPLSPSPRTPHALTTHTHP